MDRNTPDWHHHQLLVKEAALLLLLPLPLLPHLISHLSLRRFLASSRARARPGPLSPCALWPLSICRPRPGLRFWLGNCAADAAAAAAAVEETRQPTRLHPRTCTNRRAHGRHGRASGRSSAPPPSIVHRPPSSVQPAPNRPQFALAPVHRQLSSLSVGQPSRSWPRSRTGNRSSSCARSHTTTNTSSSNNKRQQRATSRKAQTRA